MPKLSAAEVDKAIEDELAEWDTYNDVDDADFDDYDWTYEMWSEPFDYGDYDDLYPYGGEA